MTDRSFAIAIWILCHKQPKISRCSIPITKHRYWRYLEFIGLSDLLHLSAMAIE